MMRWEAPIEPAESWIDPIVVLAFWLLAQLPNRIHGVDASWSEVDPQSNQLVAFTFHLQVRGRCASHFGMATWIPRTCPQCGDPATHPYGTNRCT